MQRESDVFAITVEFFHFDIYYVQCVVVFRFHKVSSCVDRDIMSLMSRFFESKAGFILQHVQFSSLLIGSDYCLP